MEEVEMNQAILFVSHKDVNLIQRKKSNNYCWKDIYSLYVSHRKCLMIYFYCLPIWIMYDLCNFISCTSICVFINKKRIYCQRNLGLHVICYMWKFVHVTWPANSVKSVVKHQYISICILYEISFASNF